jgi:hypothetical protein
MGVGMQIVCLGFAGTSQIEGEAATQLVRLERFCRSIAGCHLAIEAIRERPGTAEAGAPEHCLNADPNIAVRTAFDVAERKLDRRSV